MEPPKCCGYIPDHFVEERETIYPDIWGPLLWQLLYFLLHRINSTADMEELMGAIDDMIWVLPCRKCQDHYDAYFRENPLIDAVDLTAPLGTIQLQTFAWLLRLQNTIRQQNGKEIHLFTFNDLKEYYDKHPFKYSDAARVYRFILLSTNKYHLHNPEKVQEWHRTIDTMLTKYLQK